jgi:hypothetical protein
MRGLSYFPILSDSVILGLARENDIDYVSAPINRNAISGCDGDKQHIHSLYQIFITATSIFGDVYFGGRVIVHYLCCLDICSFVISHNVERCKWLVNANGDRTLYRQTYFSIPSYIFKQVAYCLGSTSVFPQIIGGFTKPSCAYLNAPTQIPTRTSSIFIASCRQLHYSPPMVTVRIQI